MKTSKIEGVIFDLDGTVYLGEAALPGAVDTIAELRRRGVRILFVSNKPLEPPQAYTDKLNRLGIPANVSDVITSAGVLGSYLAKHAPNLQYYVVGEDYLKDELLQHGLNLVREMDDQDPREVIDPSGIGAVIVAFDRTLDYRKLNTAYQALVRGARFLATNSDKTCPMPSGAIPDAGATIQYLEHITGRKVEMVVGKPSPVIMQVALERLGLPPERCLMVGDRLETDIRMGREAGMWTAAVLTGITRREDVTQSRYTPDAVLENLTVLLPWLESINRQVDQHGADLP